MPTILEDEDGPFDLAALDAMTREMLRGSRRRREAFMQGDNPLGNPNMTLQERMRAVMDNRLMGRNGRS